MKIVVGLGNPGIEYYASRHNAGFRVLSELALKLGANFAAKKDLYGDLSKINWASKDIVLLKPTTFMNLSGKSVQAVLNWYKIPATEMLVIHDDVSLNLGRLRVQKNGGAGGQHGIESIIECLSGSKQFDRLKLGVGPDPGGDRRAAYVLSAPPQSDREIYERCIQTAVDAACMWIQKGAQEAMNQFNGLDLNPQPAPIKLNKENTAVGDD